MAMSGKAVGLVAMVLEQAGISAATCLIRRFVYVDSCPLGII